MFRDVDEKVSAQAQVSLTDRLHWLQRRRSIQDYYHHQLATLFAPIILSCAVARPRHPSGSLFPSVPASVDDVHRRRPGLSFTEWSLTATGLPGGEA